MLEAVSHKAALAGAFAATAVVSAAGGAYGAARLARWAGRLGPQEVTVPGTLAEHGPRVVVPLVKPTHDVHGHTGHGRQQATSSYDAGETMQQMHGAVQA